MSKDLVCVGIDVAKARLDVAVRPDGDTWQAANDASGIAALVARLDQLRPTLVVREATGGYERPVTASLVNAKRDCFVTTTAPLVPVLRSTIRAVLG